MAYVNTRLTLFALISAIEDDLRSLAVGQLASEAKPTELLDKQLFDKCLRRLADEEGFESGDPTLAQLIIYSDLGDLIAILNANRQYLPTPMAQFARSVASDLQRLVPIRNRVCHIRPLSYEDLPATFDIADHLVAASSVYCPQLVMTLCRLTQEPDFVLGLDIPAYLAGNKEHNLPSPEFDETGFLGRKREVESLLKLCVGNYPVITIVGEGGIGKTALAVKVAYDLLDLDNKPFDSVVWCSSKTTQLTPKEIVTIRDGICDSLGLLQHAALALSGIRPLDPMEELLTYLREFRVLLILDNLETVLDDRIRELLERLPVGSKILITSRIGIGAFEYPVKLKPMDKGEAILLLRSLANARGVEHLVKTSNKQLEAYCARLQHNPGFIKWFVAAVQSGTTPEAVLAHPDIFLDFCMSNVYGHLDDQSRTVLRSLVLAPEGCSQGELAYVNDLTPLEIKKSLQHLLATNMVSMTSTPRGNSYATEFGVSELARMYLQKHHPVEGVEYASILSKSRQLTSLRETLHHESTRDPYSAYNITPRSDHDLIIIKYLRDALQASRIKDYVTADANVQKAKDLSPDYWEVHRVEAWLLAKQGKIPGARAAYEAAIELAPDYAPLRFWYSSLLLRIDETELALRQLREAQRLDPTSAAIQIELSRIQLYFGHFDEVRATLDPLLTRTDTSERNQRKTWDLYLQAYRREADSQLASQEPAKALGSLVQFRQAYQACPPGLIDRLMVSRLEQARGNIEQCLRMLTDSKVLDTANDLKDWLDCEVHRPPAAEAGIPIGVASSGRIMAIIPKGKYGFIDTGDRRRLFFHCHHLVNSGDWSRLTIGQMVTFVVGSNETGPCAQCVNLVEESPKDVICNGTVNKILHTKGFGFLLDSRGTEWFFHRNSFVNDKAWFSVKAGDLVSFEVGSNEKGVCATKIRCLNK